MQELDALKAKSLSELRQIAKAMGITEQLKANDQMEWVRRMNNIRSRANEIIYNELIFT